MLLLSFLEQFDIALDDFLIVLATVGLLLFFMLSALIMPLLGVFTEAVYLAKRKAFHDKCALQISQSTFGVGLFVFLVLSLTTGMILHLYQPEMLEPPLLWRPLSFFVPSLAALFFLLLYLLLWRPLKKLRILHFPLGLCAALLSLAIFLAGFLLITATQQPMLPLILWNTPLDVFRMLALDFASSPVLWALLGYLFCTGLAAGSGLAQLWLIIRRHKADYGRDYYVFAMRYCARFALGFTLAATALAGGIYWLLGHSVPLDLSQPHDLGLMTIAWGLPLSCCILWLSIVKSETPLRHKPGAFFACLFLVIALCAQLLMLANTFPLA